MTVKIFDLDFNAIFDDAIAVYQDATGYQLGRQDAERLMLQVFAGMAHKWGTAWLASSQQNYLEFMTDDNLDYYGDFFGVDRLDSTPATAVVRFTFSDPLETGVTIYRNTIATGSNDNGTYTFKVLEDTYVEKDREYFDIEMTEFIDDATNSGADANDVEIGEINALDDSSFSYSYVSEVANITESVGGADGETDTNYRERLQIAPFRFSTAGVAGAYKFHALSVTPDVIDVGVTKEQYNIYLWLLPKNFDGEYNLEIIGDGASQLSDLTLDGLTLNYMDEGKLYWSLTGNAGALVFSLYDDSAKTSLVARYSGAEGDDLVIAEQGGSGITGTISIDFASEDTDTTNEILSAMQDVALVDDLMYPASGESEVRPLNDVVITGLVDRIDFVVSDITMSITTKNIETVKNRVLQVVNIWIDSLKNKVGSDVVKKQLEGLLSAIPGVYTVSVTLDSDISIESFVASSAEVYFGTFSESNLTVSVFNG